MKLKCVKLNQHLFEKIRFKSVRKQSLVPATSSLALMDSSLSEWSATEDMTDIGSINHEDIDTITMMPPLDAVTPSAAGFDNACFVTDEPSISVCDMVSSLEASVTNDSQSESKHRTSVKYKSVLDPDYPKTTFHLEVTQLLTTSKSNVSQDISSIEDSLTSGYSSPPNKEEVLNHDSQQLNLISHEQMVNFHVLCPGKLPIESLKQTIEQRILCLTKSSDILNASHSSEEDLYSLCLAMERLQMTGWYYRNVSRQQVKFMLKDSAVGSFLVRDSTDPGHLFALSVRTLRGTTNVRIQYDNGQFRLDCEDCLRVHMPVFSCIVKLVNFYARMGRDENMNNPCVWLETSGRRDMPVKLTRPLRQELPSLRHLSRLAICSQLPMDSPTIQKQSTPTDSIGQLPLPNLMINYLKQYPYSC